VRTRATTFAAIAIALLPLAALAQSTSPPKPAPSAQATPTPSPSPATPESVRGAIVAEFVKVADDTIGVTTVQAPFGNVVSGFQNKIVHYLMTFNAAQQAGYKALLESMESKADKQLGASATSTGTTSLASKGLVPQLLGAAVEEGALDQSVSGKVVTFRAKPAALVGLVYGYGGVRQNEDGMLRLANRFSGSISFDTSRGTSAGTLTADSSQFSGWSARVEIINERDPASSSYAPRWLAELSSHTHKAYLDAAEKLYDSLNAWDDFAAWQARLVASAEEIDHAFAAKGDRKAAETAFKAMLGPELDKLGKLPTAPTNVKKALEDYATTLLAVQQDEGKLYEFIGKAPVLAVEFTATRDPKLPDLYATTGIWQSAFGKDKKASLTLNAELDYYGSVPPGTTHQLKSFVFSAEVSRQIGDVLGLKTPTLSLAGRYSYLPNDTVTSSVASTTQDATTSNGTAGTSVALKGSVGLVQAKLTVPIKGSGVKIPLSVTLANRSEAVKESFVRANFGVTLDLDTLLAK
jgi:hypothetical protein